MLLLGYFIAASHGYDGFLFTTVMMIIAGVMGLEVGIKKGVSNVQRTKTDNENV